MSLKLENSIFMPETRSVRSFVLLTLFVAMFCIRPAISRGQEVRATIGGRVTDAQGAVVPNAAVTVTSDDTGVPQQTTTNAQGAWTVQFLLPGHYHFSVMAPGFKVAERTGITLQAADNKELDTQLQLGETTQSVVVNSEAPLIDTTSATSGTVITSELISELPSSTHVATLFASLSPGVLLQDQSPGNTHMWSNIGASAILADGGRDTRSNSFQLDGMPDVKQGGQVSFIPPTDAVEEFRVQTNAYDASIGRQAGATINLQTKSGGKNYHGSLYEYNQNDFLNAYLMQTKIVPGAKNPVHFNEYGGTFGGPVWIPKVYNGSKKTFFFVSFDDTHNIDPRPGGFRTVPTELERRGDFSQSFVVDSTGKKFPVRVYNPFDVAADGTRATFKCDAAGNPIAPNAAGRQTGVTDCMGPDPNNPGAQTYRPRIPTQLLNPISLNILKFVPLPNKAADLAPGRVNGADDLKNFASQAARRDTFPVVSIRVDHAWNNSHHTFGTVRWNHLDEFIDDFFQNIATGNFHNRIAKNLGLDHVWVMSPSKVLDLRFSINRFVEPNFDKGAGFVPTQLGFPTSFVSQLRKPSFPEISGFGGVPSTDPNNQPRFGTGQAGDVSNNTYYTWAGNLTHVHANHTMHYGAEYWILQQANGGIGNQGRFDFGSNWTTDKLVGTPGTGVGSNFGSFLLGLPTGGNVPNNASGFFSQRYTAIYFQDDWRVTPKLTLNLGMRWDYERPVTERFNRMTSNFDLSVINPISPAAQAAYARIQSGSTATQCSGAGVPSAVQKQCMNALDRLKTLVPVDQFRVPGAQLFAGVGSQPRTFSNTDYHEWQPRFELPTG